MNARWSPESHIRITGDGMVIEIKLPGVVVTSLAATFEKKVLCVSGKHEDFGRFESRFEIPANHKPIEAKIILENSVLHIDVPSGKQKKDVVLGPIPIPIKFSGILPKPSKTAVTHWCSTPRSMMIYCNSCGKHFDIVATKGAQDYRCLHCGKVQVFDLETFINQAIELGSKMLRKKRGSR
jgi:hypothetical protein